MGGHTSNIRRMGLLMSEASWQHPRLSHRALLLGLALGVAQVTIPARALAASEEDTAAARSLAQEGLEAFKAERFQDAADLFERAEALVHSPVHLLYRARAQVKIGQLVNAQEAYIKIIREEFASDAPKAFLDAKESAKSEVEEIKGRLAKLTVKVSGPTEGITLTLDGDPVAAVLVGVPMPADPGEHTLEASAEGFSSETASVTLAEGQQETVELTLTKAPDATAVAAIGSEDSGPEIDDSPDSGTMRTLSYVSFGVGAVGLGVGTVFLIQGLDKESEADTRFDDLAASGVSNPQEEAAISDLDEEATSAKNIGVAGLVVGGIGVAAGVTLFILSSDSEESAQGPSVTPWIGYNSAGVFGRF